MDAAAFATLSGLLWYIDGDYRDEATFRAIRDEKVKVLKAIPYLTVDDVVRGQFRGYRSETGVAVDSQVETFVAMCLWNESWRWQGVPFYIRAGKHLPVTCTEVVARLRQPPAMFRD